MHVLTKIFIVLVSMLAVLLVPLVVVYSHNEDSYRSRYEQERSAAATANMLLQQAQTASSSALARSELELQELSLGKSQLTQNLQDANAKVRQLEAALASSEKLQANIDAKLAVLATSAMAGQELTESLVNELRTLRQDAMQDAKRVVQLDEALRDVSAQLQVAVQARRAVQEELQQLREELAQAVRTAATYEQEFGALKLAGGPLPPPVSDLDATVVNVRRGADQTLAEINAGSRDGVEEGWIMMVARGGNFLANLRIIAVEINRSTGVIELEDTASRGEVQPGDRVLARSGAG